MPVFYKGTQRILFIHVPKAGGTSIEFLFQENGYLTAYLDRGGAPESLNPVRRCSPQHMTAAMLATVFDVDKFDYVFMTVRNPIARLLSEYAMAHKVDRSVAQLEAWLFKVLGHVLGDPTHLDNHLRPQSDFWLPQAEVFKLEDGLGDPFVRKLEARIGATFTQRRISRHMAEPEPLPDYAKVQAGLQALFQNYYEEDVKRFGYG